MKKSAIIIVSILLFTFPTDAQNLAGKIYYQHDIKVQFDESRYEQMTEARRERVRQRMQNMGKMKKVLVFDQGSSLYRDFIAEKDARTDQEWETGEGRLRWRFMRPKTIIFQEFDKWTTTEQKEAFDKKFLITDEREKANWKMSGEIEVIMDHNCQIATWQKNDSTVIKAWFCTDIPVPAGPAAYNALPGIILKLTVNENETHIVATDISFYSPKEGELDKPKKGKKVTRSEYDQIVKEKREEMRAVYGQGRRP